jgi:leucine dehydrogenase
LFALLAEHDHEQLSAWSDPASGYRGLIAIHDTTLGPGMGGTRLWRYSSDRDALVDVLRLARGMTYKAAVAGLEVGGGKSVILAGADGAVGAVGAAREALFRAHGRHIASLHGRYITTEDVGTSPADMAFVRAETEHAVGLPSRSGDPSPVTAYGVFRGIQACLRHRDGSESLAGKRVAIQGVGHVGYHLARLLHGAGAALVAADVDPGRVRRVVDEFGARAAAPAEIAAVRADVFAPCALGAVIDDATLPRLGAGIVAGGANNQLAEARHGDALEARGVLYAPDYVINAGGLISVYAEWRGWPAERAHEMADGIGETVLRVLRLAREEGIPSHRAADRLAQQRIAAAAQVRTTRG